MCLLVLLLLVSLAAIPSSSTPNLSSPYFDVFRPHVGTRAKAKVCLRCRHYLDASKESRALVAKTEAALEQSIEFGARQVAEKAAKENMRAQLADAVGEPLFQYDFHDPVKRERDAALAACLQFEGPRRSECLRPLHSPTLALPDPSGVGQMQLKVPDAKNDPRGLSLDPREAFRPPNPLSGARPLVPVLPPPFTGHGPADATPPDDATSTPFREGPQEVASLLETASQTAISHGQKATTSSLAEEVSAAGSPALKSGSRRGANVHPFRAGSELLPEVIPDDFFMNVPRYPRSRDGREVQMVSELSICVNEASRELAVSLFRGLVGRFGDIECVDDPDPGVT
jgi:hypothetical protein